MIHIIIVALLFAFALVAWNLVHFAPRSIAMVIPDRICLIFGLVLLPLGAFSALAAGYGQQNAQGFIGSVVIALVGLWFLLIKPAGYGIANGDIEQLIRRVFTMMAMLMVVLVVSFYLGESKLVAVPNLLLIAAGFWLTTSFFRDMDRGR
ncbi:MAG TPA: hypothetical protein VFS30_11240 [Dehalococcoidia bacterium]|nr:hypothetical protein [Dehalococcoidia bacterium]